MCCPLEAVVHTTSGATNVCRALLLSKMLSHVQRTLDISPSNIHEWTDSMVVLVWLSGDPRQFKTCWQ